MQRFKCCGVFVFFFVFLVPNKKNTTVGCLIKEAATDGIFMGLLYQLISAFWLISAGIEIPCAPTITGLPSLHTNIYRIPGDSARWETQRTVMWRRGVGRRMYDAKGWLKNKSMKEVSGGGERVFAVCSTRITCVSVHHDGEWIAWSQQRSPALQRRKAPL